MTALQNRLSLAREIERLGQITLEYPNSSELEAFQDLVRMNLILETDRKMHYAQLEEEEDEDRVRSVTYKYTGGQQKSFRDEDFYED